MRLLILAAVAGLALARPETYREKEDFQFSRSSTDEGSKSGYYGAQRGNMGGNYERAHNMDHLAQNQMSGLVRTVEGELGDGAKQTTGSVYTAANSRGVYGSGQYDTSNLEGRNFQEGESHGSQSHSSLTSHHGSAYKGQFSTSNQAGYGSNQLQNTGYGISHNQDSRYGGYHSAGNSEQALYSNHHQQASDSLQSASQYEDRNTAQNSGFTAQNSGYYSQATGYAGQQGQLYDQARPHNSDGYGSSNIHSRLVSEYPVRIVIRPGTRVVVPVAAQTYDASQSASTFDQNAINSETEVLNSHDHHQAVVPNTKKYESSYSYRKEWEKHDTKPISGAVPLAIPTVNPYPANSELYEDAQAQTLEHQRQSASGISSQSHSSHSGYNVNSASSRQADYNARLHSSGVNVGSSAYHGANNGVTDGAYTVGAHLGTGNGASNLNQIENSNANPKSYQSSYSYHKSWERQGDPYIIKPSTNGAYDGQASGKLTDVSLNQGAYDNSHQYGSHHQSHRSYSSHSEADCDENGHIRVARSPHSPHHHHVPEQTQEDLGQQTQQQWDYNENLDQQTQPKWDKIEELGQQTQNTWDQFGQQTENKFDKLQNEGQQAQKLWNQQETQNHWEKIDDFGQQTQNQWDQHDHGQQTQNTWDKLEKEPQSQTELGQQTQDTWTTLQTMPSANGPSLTEQNPSGPYSSRQNKQGNMGQSSENTFEIAQSSNDQNLNTEPHIVESGVNKNFNHHGHTIWDEIKTEEIGQENEDTVESDHSQFAGLGQQTQVSWGNINQNENSFHPWHQETEDKAQVGLTDSEQSNAFSDMPNPHPWMYNQMHHRHENMSNSNQYFAHSSSSSSFSGSHSHVWEQENSTNFNNSYSSNVHMNINGSTLGSSIMGLWDKLDNIEKQTIPSQENYDKDSRYVGQDTAHVFGTQVQHSEFNSHNTDLTSEQFDGTASNAHHNVIELHTTIKPLQSSTEAIIKKANVQPHDIGRGDIGPEDSSNKQSKPDDSKAYKTPEEIETLSLTTDTEKHNVVQVNKNTEDDRDLSVMGLHQQKHFNDQDKKEQSGWQSDCESRLGCLLTSSDAISTTTVKTQNINHHINVNTHTTNEELEGHDMEQQFENRGWQNSDQQNLVSQFVDSQKNQHRNTEQQFVDFGQQFETQNTGQDESFYQENRKHEAEELGHQHEQFDQVSLSGWKPDENFDQQEHKLENWGQPNENLEQQSQSGWVENMEDQQVQTAWKPTEELQQHSQVVEPFFEPLEDLSQHVQTAWAPTEELEQHSQVAEPFVEPLEDLSQQVQTAWKPTDDLQQHSQLAESFAKPMEDLEQQVQTAWRPTEDIQQQTQVAGAFAPKVDLNKENPSTYNKQPEVVEEFIVPKKVSAVVDSPPEVESITEKPGFWRNVGSKFTNAKDKVASWFSSSSR